MQSFLQQKLPQLHIILKTNKVKRAYIFGSACTDLFTDDSDVDILIAFEDGLDPIEYGENFFKIAYQAESLLHKKVDLITESSLSNSYFIAQMNKTKVQVYGT